MGHLVIPQLRIPGTAIAGTTAGPYPAAMQLASKTYDVKDVWAVQELYHANGWTDGLPIVPPTRQAVEACLEWAMTPPDQLIGIEPVRGRARSPPRNSRSTPSWPAACRCISPSC